jgi:hypothetical protein
LAWVWMSETQRRAGENDDEDEDGDKDTGRRGWASGVVLDSPTRAETAAAREKMESFIFAERARGKDWSDVGISSSFVSGVVTGLNHHKRDL